MGEQTVYVLSDSVGETAELVARAAISQFERNAGVVQVERIPFISSVKKVDDALRRVVNSNHTMVIYTLVVPSVKRYLEQRCEEEGIRTVDIMGPIMSGLKEVLGTEPREEPGIIHRMDERYFQRVAAVEFAVKYDDGKDPRGFLEADVVLVGVSRTSKTPVCMYLAHREIKAANYPLVPEVEVPKELHQVKGRVIGLTITAQQLQQIRRQRIRRLGLNPSSHYSDLNRIRQELQHADEVFSSLGCPVVEVTSRAVEETATTVLEIMRKGEWISE